MSSSPPTDWSFKYWRELDGRILQYDKRKIVLEVLASHPVGTFSTTALTDAIVPELNTRGVIQNQKRYDDQNLNKILPEFERLGLLYRIPKFERDDSYLILPNQRILSWIESSVDWTDTEGYLTPGDTPDSWGTAYTGLYITKRLSDTDPTEAGLHIGAESIIYSSVNEYVYGIIDPFEIDFEIGSLEIVRDADFQLSPIIEKLSLGTSIPDSDGPFVGADGVHDYAIFGRVSGITQLVSVSQLERRLEQQLSVWLASAQSHYSQTYNLDDTPVRLSPEQRSKAAQAVREHDDIPAARERFGIDVVVTRPDATADELGHVCFGLYRRTGADDPQL